MINHTLKDLKQEFIFLLIELMFEIPYLNKHHTMEHEKYDEKV